MLDHIMWSGVIWKWIIAAPALKKKLDITKEPKESVKIFPI